MRRLIEKKIDNVEGKIDTIEEKNITIDATLQQLLKEIRDLKENKVKLKPIFDIIFFHYLCLITRL